MKFPCTVDFHCHSTASDGSLSPAEVVQAAHAQGVSCLALTDHDTVTGLVEAEAEAGRLGMQWISGIELSAKWDPGYFHLLGYGFDRANAAFMQAIQLFQSERAKRIDRILLKLGELGLDLKKSDLKISDHGSPGRPHVAQAMVEKGHVQSVSEAFASYLGHGSHAYVDKEIFSPKEAIELIVCAGGVPILAHPVSLHLKPSALSAVLIELKSYGLAGIEAYNSAHSRYQCNRLARTAQEIGLWVTGGSDFHGALKPLVQMGRVKKNRKILSQWVSPAFFDRLGCRAS